MSFIYLLEEGAISCLRDIAYDASRMEQRDAVDIRTLFRGKSHRPSRDSASLRVLGAAIDGMGGSGGR